MELSVGLEPLLWRTILMLLEVRDEVIKDSGKVIFKTIIADKAFGPDKEARGSLRDKGGADGSINEPRGKEGIQFIKGILEFCSCVKELRLAAIQWLNDALDVLLNVPIPQGLIPMQFRKFVDVEVTVCDTLHCRLGHPMPARENILRELQGLHEGVLGCTWLVKAWAKTLGP